MKCHHCGFTLAALLVACSVSAGTIYDNGGPDNITGLYSDASDLPGPAQYTADDFVLSAGNNTITSVHWWGGWDVAAPGPVTDFIITIYEQESGAPAVTALHTVNVGMVAGVDTGEDTLAGGFDIYEYSTFIDPITLTAGETYFLSITNHSGDSSADWFWATHERPGGDGYFRIDPSEPWVQDAVGVDVAFYLTDDVAPQPVPVPAGVGLLGMGLAGLALRWRKRAA